MLTLTFGLLLFIGAHLLREFGVRDAAKAKLGAPRYKASIAAVLLASIALIVLGKSTAPFVQVWVPPFHWRVFSDLLMLSASIFFVAGFLPLSHCRNQLQHPALISVLIWGCAHLLANGDLASVILFGSLFVWAFIKIISLSKALRVAPDTQNLSPALHWDIAAIILGFIVYSLLLIFHGQLFGFALVDIR